MRLEQMSSAERRGRRERDADRASRCCASSAVGGPLRARHPRAPRRRRARLARRRCRGSWSALGKDSVMFMSARRLPAARTSTASSTSTAWSSAPPDDIADAHARLPGLRQHRPQPGRGRSSATGAHILNVDHHHDNTRFGDINHVVRTRRARRRSCGTSCATSASQPTPTIADALYVGLVTDTGSFMYENTGARAHVMAAELDRRRRRRARDLPAPVRGHARAPSWRCSRARSTHVSATTTARSRRAARPRRLRRGPGREECYTEGDHRPPARRRRHEGRGADARDPPLDGGAGRAKVSLRATDGDVDVSAIARAGGGGGHRQAAGFTTELERRRARRVPARADRRAARPTAR